MKILLIIPFTLISLPSKTSKATVAPFSSISVSPFYSKGDSIIEVKTSITNLSFSVYISNDRYENECIVSDTLTKSGTFTYTYDNAYTRSNNTVFVRYYTDDPDSYCDSQPFSRNVTKSKYEYIENNEDITSDSSLVVVKSDGSYSLKKLSYSFTGFDGLYVPSYYHKIDLSDFRINVNKSEQTFFTCTPSLIIKNYNNIFSDIAGASSTVTFNLTLQKYTNYYTFKLANNLYVNKQTLLLSSEPKDGYVKTKYIYFPVNEMHNQDNYEAYFSFTKFGIDKDMLIYSFSFKALKNTFGDCSNSKYCIIRYSYD